MNWKETFLALVALGIICYGLIPTGYWQRPFSLQKGETVVEVNGIFHLTDEDMEAYRYGVRTDVGYFHINESDYHNIKPFLSYRVTVWQGRDYTDSITINY